MFERYQGGEQAILVHVDFKDEAAREDLRELEMLATSAGATILGTITTRRDSPQAKFFIGTGKADEIAQEVRRLEADLVIFNHALTPAPTQCVATFLSNKYLTFAFVLSPNLLNQLIHQFFDLMFLMIFFMAINNMNGDKHKSNTPT